MKPEVKTPQEKQDIALKMGRDRVPVAEISKAISVNRRKVMDWLNDAGIEPVMLRKRSKSTGSVRNTPLALSIEEGVRRRVEEQSRREAKEARGA